MKLSLVLHAHQPYGNFDHVFEEGIRVCYGPVLDLIEEFDQVRLSLHFSGSLLEWLERHAPERIEQLRRLVERGQVEPVTAGMYEPVLALLPPHDRAPQVRLHRAELRRLLGRDSHVGWLTERVWEPSIPPDLVDGGIAVVPLDDRHFLSAGLTEPELVEPFVTEYQGKALTLVPSSEPLRMGIPWRPVDECIDLLRRWAAEGRPLAVFGDDIEKFGMWPGTHRTVIRGGWLRRFFRALARLGDRIELLPLGEAVEAVPPRRKIYIPDGSYPEMLQWSLPPARQRDLIALKERLARSRLGDAVFPFLRAGIYYQFLARYPEANHLHKRMLDVSHRVARRHRRAGTGTSAVPALLLDLWRSQANDVYWHGWFGGTYLPHLRQAVWSALLRAEHALTPAGERRRPLRLLDLDADRRDEAVIDTGSLTVVVDPVEGAVVELSDRECAVNLTDTLARRPEAYHPAGVGAPPYDRARRACFVDRFLAPGRPPARNAEIDDRGDFAGQPYAMRARRSGNGAAVTLRRDAAALDATVRVEKRFEVRGRELVARYTVQALDAPLEARFGVECNFGIYLQQRPGRIEAGGGSLDLGPRGGARSGASAVVLAGPEAAVRIETDARAVVDVRPVHTVSQSEQGMERTQQAVACLFTWPLRLSAGGRFQVTLRLIVE